MEAEAVAVISASETIPVKESVGVAVILSEKVAVRVTTSELETRLSELINEESGNSVGAKRFRVQ